MKIGALTVAYGDLPLEQALDRLVGLGIEAIELGTGNFPGNAHCDPKSLLDDPRRAQRLRAQIEDRGLSISALSCHGNPLHPDPEVARAAHTTWLRTARLAEILQVGVVNGFSGCPGDGRGASVPNWITCPWPPEYAEVLAWQWAESAIPYWREQCEIAGAHGVRIGLEMHPGFLVYNPETLISLRQATGPELGANFDPSHLFWQGIDPVRAIRELAEAGALFHVHAKDTFVDRHNVERNGVLDTKTYDQVPRRAWTFRTVGFGHGEAEWREIVSALRVAGYDGVISIEHEDILMSRDEGLERAVQTLRSVVPRERADAPWWI
ncbi:MAG TPA: sugar phosphate isomerase/epimerase [Solirubrobacteraceae bacterium]|jgi:sugar phosphate isomerase/epimerase|nr:sugar phosphate isomerase/epimerase [Solirubrobacteraceae bacterium]